MQCFAFDCPLQASRIELTSKLFRALSDPTRLSILRMLRTGPKRVIDLVNGTKRAQPNVSMHLAYLRDCGIVRPARMGRETYYSLAAAEMAELLTLADALVTTRKPNACDCARYQD